MIKWIGESIVCLAGIAGAMWLVGLYWSADTDGYSLRVGSEGTCLMIHAAVDTDKQVAPNVAQVCECYGRTVATYLTASERAAFTSKDVLRKLVAIQDACANKYF
jgi:hypothetical protein